MQWVIHESYLDKDKMITSNIILGDNALLHATIGEKIQCFLMF